MHVMEYPGLRPVEESDDLFSLASRIRNDFPHSISLYNTLLMKAKGHNSSFTYDIYILDDHPHAHVVFWITERYKIGLHCREEEIPLLAKIVQDSNILPLQEETFKLFHLPDILVTPLQRVIETKSPGCCIVRTHHSFIYKDIQDYPLKCPAGMRLCRLGKAGVRHLLKMSTYYKNTNVEAMYTFTENMPALGIYLDSTVSEEKTLYLETLDLSDPQDIPVAWISSYPYGSIGMLVTSEGYRGRGLGSLLTEAIARLQVSSGYMPHAHVDINNEPSVGMFRKLPGWVVTHQASWLCYFKEK